MMNLNPKYINIQLTRHRDKRNRAMNNWLRLFRAYKAVTVVDLGSLKVDVMVEKYQAF